MSVVHLGSVKLSGPEAFQQSCLRLGEVITRAAWRIRGAWERLLWTDEQYIALVWPSIERGWFATLLAWARGAP